LGTAQKHFLTVQKHRTAMIECHGTRAKIGDPIEADAVAKVFGEHGVYIGSVKPNLGHREGASGLSSLIKMVLALEKKTIPPNINFNTPNPQIPFEDAKLTVLVKRTPWPKDRLERVGVNSFGIGGSNAHVLLESAASFGLTPAALGGVRRKKLATRWNQPCLLVFSAKHPQSLRRIVQNHESYLASYPVLVHDMAFSLAMKREVLSNRQYCVTTGTGPFVPSVVTKPSANGQPGLIFVFTGQGAQWAQMGKELIATKLTFSSSLMRLDEVLATLPNPSTWKIHDELLRPGSESRLSETEISRPCCTAIQLALVDLLAQGNIKPQGMIGHSSGEIAAAYACGAIKAAETIMIAYYRGLSMRNIDRKIPGGMAAIGLGRDDVASFLKPGVIVGCENSPESVTLSGDKEVLEGVTNDIRTAYPKILVRSLLVDCAYHSRKSLSLCCVGERGLMRDRSYDECCR
jgi:acyl transferase domain-containing protein